MPALYKHAAPLLAPLVLLAACGPQLPAASGESGGEAATVDTGPGLEELGVCLVE